MKQLVLGIGNAI
jgi:hypothetical protein